MFRHELCTCSRDSRILLSSKRMYFTRRQQRGPLTYHLCQRRRIDKSRKRCFSLRHSSGRGACGLFFRTALLRNTLTLRTMHENCCSHPVPGPRRLTKHRGQALLHLRTALPLGTSRLSLLDLTLYTVPNIRNDIPTIDRPINQYSTIHAANQPI